MTAPTHVGAHRVVALTESAHTIVREPLTTDKGTLRRYRHAISAIVNGEDRDVYSRTLPATPQARIKALLKGKPGYSFDEQEQRFRETIELSDKARPGNVKAQSARAIAEKAIEVVEARREAAKPAPVVNNDSWGDDDENGDW